MYVWSEIRVTKQINVSSFITKKQQHFFLKSDKITLTFGLLLVKFM